MFQIQKKKFKAKWKKFNDKYNQNKEEAVQAIPAFIKSLMTLIMDLDDGLNKLCNLNANWCRLIQTR